MPPIQMSRSEYEQKYGVQPTAASSDLDTTPAPIRMTREEYNSLYRPEKKSFLHDFRDDIKETGVAQQEALATGVDRTSEIEGRVASGETGTVKSVFQRFGTGLGTAANILGETVIGTGKAILPQKAEEAIATGVGAAAEELKNSFKREMEKVEERAVMGDENAQKVVQTNKEIKDAWENDPNFRSDVQAAGGFLEWMVLPGASKTAIRKTVEVAGDPVQRTAQLKETASLVADSFANSRQDKRVQNVVNEIEGIETKYAPTRRKADMDPNVNESRTRIAQSNVLENAVDTDGLIRTKEKGGAVDTYRAQTIEGVEDIVKRNLEIEGSKMNLEELKSDLLINISNSGLEGADLTKAIKSIDNEIKGLSMRADEFGDVLLAKIQDVKTSTYKHIDYTKPTGVTYRKTLARTYKEAIERKSDMNIAEVNAELAKYYNDLDRLADLDGKRVKGGRLGRYTASLAGSAIGGVAGSAGGAAGAVAGGLAGGELSAFLQGRSMARTFSKGVRGDVPESGVLAQAKAQADAGVKDLTKADAPVGAPRDLINNPNFPEATKVAIAKIEGQIKQNIKQQKKAIAAGDFTLVEALKNVYQVLVKRLSDTIKAAKENMADPAQRKGGFIGNNPFQRTRTEAQTSAITTPNTAKAIDSNVPEIEQTVKADVEDSIVMERLMALDLLDVDPADTARLEELQKTANKRALKEDEMLEAQQIVESVEGNLPEAELPATTKTTDLVEEAKKMKAQGKTFDDFLAAKYVENKPLNYKGDGISKASFKLREVIDNPELFDKYPVLADFNVKFTSGSVNTEKAGITGRSILLTPKLYDKIPNQKRIDELNKKLQPYLDKEAAGTLTDAEYKKAAAISDELGEVESGRKDAIGVQLNADGMRSLYHEIQHAKQGTDGYIIKDRTDILSENADLSTDPAYWGDRKEIDARFAEQKWKTRSQLEDIWKQANK